MNNQQKIVLCFIWLIMIGLAGIGIHKLHKANEKQKELIRTIHYPYVGETVEFGNGLVGKVIKVDKSENAVHDVRLDDGTLTKLSQKEYKIAKALKAKYGF